MVLINGLKQFFYKVSVSLNSEKHRLRDDSKQLQSQLRFGLSNNGKRRRPFALIVLSVVEAQRPHNQTICPLLRTQNGLKRTTRRGGEIKQEGEMKSKEYNISLHVFLAFLHTDISLFLAISHLNTLKS